MSCCQHGCLPNPPQHLAINLAQSSRSHPVSAAPIAQEEGRERKSKWLTEWFRRDIDIFWLQKQQQQQQWQHCRTTKSIRIAKARRFSDSQSGEIRIHTQSI